jgi:hypothetical protein
MRHSSLKEYEKSLSGGEPTWKNGNESITRALNWYNYHSDTKESKKFTISYLKEIKADKKDIEILEKVSDEYFKNLGFVCRMKLRGAPFSKKEEMWIQDSIENLKKKNTQSSVTVESTPTVSIQERVAEKTKYFIAEIEGAIDDCLFVKDFTLFDPYEQMQALGMKAAHSNALVKFFDKRREEISLALKDKELAEGYSNFKKTELKEYLKLLEKIIADAKKLAHNAKLSRAPRKKKAKPVDKVVAKMQYKKEDNGYKIVSINPVDLVGCTQLWVFNTKTRKLGVYNSVDADGLNVKGTTIVNFNEETSIQKTLRKPEVTLPEVIKSGKVAIRKLLPNINAVEQKLTGRINADTILLRAIK